MQMQATPLNISTMTISGHLGAIPDLKKLYTNCAFIPYWWVGEGIIKIQLNDEQKGICTEDILHHTSKQKKRFFNQSTLVFRLQRSETQWKEVNIKLFKNGGFQMTGISSTEMAKSALTQLIATNKSRDIWPSEPYIKDFHVCMMNSDFSINKAIRRDRLYRVLVEEYGLTCSYEPTVYQGVNTKFFWNKQRPAAAPPGICACPTPCAGDGGGYGAGHCKKITISPFRTGRIIITGAECEEQLQDAYAFINGVFRRFADQVLRDELEAETAPTPKKKTNAPTTSEGIIRQKMRASPRNVVRMVAVNAA
jgi:TATA-box binding protein (TBP) (component of TFIID and TFIIIB)